jgi:hypothetical protein
MAMGLLKQVLADTPLSGASPLPHLNLRFLETVTKPP